MTDELLAVSQHIIDLERRALEQWCRGNPSGFIELFAPDVTYFDPFCERRIDGADQLRDYYEALRGKIHAERIELINPKVLIEGAVAVLTFNFASTMASGSVQRWNSTEVYRNGPSGWRLVQSHWSLTKPQ
jgi:hypothetical protein